MSPGRPSNRDEIRDTSPKQVIWNIIIYVRLSKDDGRDESLSVANQKKRLYRHLDRLERRCPDEVHNVVGVFVDDGYTGTDENRNGLQNALGHIESGQANCLMFIDLSRLYRNIALSQDTIETLFYEKRVRVITISDPVIDTYLNPHIMRSASIPQANVQNDTFALQTSNKVRDVFAEKRELGECTGGFAPYGYVKDPSDYTRFVVDEEAAQVVRLVFDLFINQGYSKRGIALHLTGQGIPCPAAYKVSKGMKYHNPHKKDDDKGWSAATVARMLNNMTYLGHMVQGKQEVESYKRHKLIQKPREEWVIVKNTHEAIISQDIFDKAQAISAKDTRTPNSTGKRSLLSGLIRCADCGKACHRSIGGSGRNVYYVCRTYKDKRNCTPHSFSEAKLKQAILDAIKMQVAHIVDLHQVVERINNSPVQLNTSKRIIAQIKSANERLAKVIKRKETLYYNFADGIITKEEYNQLKRSLSQEEEELNNTLEMLKAEQNALLDGIKYDDPYLQAFLKCGNIEELDHSILNELIDVVYVHEDKSLTIVFTYNDQYQRILEFV